MSVFVCIFIPVMGEKMMSISSIGFPVYLHPLGNDDGLFQFHSCHQSLDLPVYIDFIAVIGKK